MEGCQVIFDEKWDAKSTVTQNDAFWADKPSVKSIALLKTISTNECAIEFAVDAPGVPVCRIPDHNVTVNLLDHSGINSRRGEPYLVGDIIMVLCVRRENYTYSAITKRGFKYINILERDRIKSILDDPEVCSDLLEVKIRFFPINSGCLIGLHCDQEVTSDENVTPKVSTKHFINDVMKMVEESCQELMQNSQDENSNEHKIAKKGHRNICVLASALIERALRTRNSVITTHGEGFERILQKVEAAHTNKSVVKTRGDTKSVGNILGKHSKLRVLDEICCKYRKKPVIIVPSGTMSIVARQNIKQLLEDNQFVDPQESLRNNGAIVTGLPMNAVEVVRTIAGRNIRFRVVENSYTTKFTTSDWISVVCVVLNIKGGQWQFSGYPFESFVDMFMTMKGALFTYDTDHIPAEMNNWDVKVFRINRSHRHHDASIAKDFWQYMESFLLQPRQRKIHHNKRLS